MTFVGHSKAITALSRCPSPRQFASGSEDCGVRIWCIDTAHCVVRLNGHVREVLALAANPTAGSQLLSASADETIKVWNLGSNTCV